jgi:phosphatidate cytidylyltransferase
MVVGAGSVTLTAAGTIVLAIMGFCVAFGALKTAVITGLIGGAIVALVARGKFVWAASGFAYASAALLASILVRQDLVNGFAALMFVLLVVWATDIGGYFAGRSIGGPKLWPRVSPKKTWAGAIGGFAASLVVASGFAAGGFGRAIPLLLVSAVLSVVSQLGDLFESAVKRRFGVKDSSHLIPGHGGLMDRLDGFVAAILMAWIIGFLRHGVHSAGSGLMVW